MNLYFRFIYLLIRRVFRRPRMGLFDACDTTFRVNPMDLDLNLHMNNGRYLSIMDLGRFDLMLRAGIFWKLVRGGYFPVVVSESIRFKQSLESFQKFTLVSRVESWDEKDFFIVQQFRNGDMVAAEGYIKGRFKQRGRKGSVPTEDVFKIAGEPFPGVRLSERALAQRTMESHLSGESR